MRNRPVFRDGRRVEAGSTVSGDICIIGAGAAGITLAREFADTAWNVILIESGGFELSQKTQSLAEGRITGEEYYALDVARLRMFGGTTGHWTGACRPLDHIDFQRRPWIPGSGWPLQKRDLLPYYRRAQEVCELGPLDYSPDTWSAGKGNTPLPIARGSLKNIVLQKSPPVRFGRAYRSELRDADNVEVILHSNVVDFDLHQDASAVRQARVECLVGNSFNVSAGQFILTAGAIENARLLLASEEFVNSPLPRNNVGRYFMEHLSIVGGIFLPTDPTVSLGYYQLRRQGQTKVFGAISPTAKTIRERRVLNGRIQMTPSNLRSNLKYVAPSLVEAVVALRNDPSGDELLEHIPDVARELDDLVMHGYESDFQKDQMSSKQPFLLHAHLEQAPNRDSGVSLAEETDQLGVPRVRLDWDYGEMEQRTLRELLQMLARQVGAAGLGRVRIDDVVDGPGWEERVRGAWHQMGTTRMSPSSRRGVVNSECRAHGVENLFIAGSSVFPTSGHANPTLTIVALALRLADHIKSET